MFEKEFDRQLENILQKGYPRLAGLEEEDFKKHIEPLKKRLGELPEPAKGHIPFVIVIKHELVAVESAMPLIVIKGAQGIVNMHPVEPQSFHVIDGLEIPHGLVYLLADVDTGQETLNVTPHNALKIIQNANRFPLTIDEGVALLTQFPEVLIDKKNYNCFQMSGSRRGDQRIPSMWMSYGKPRLGWCWDNNPHTWLGSASCGKRIEA